MTSNTICIYHGNCMDGFTGAWVVRKALGDTVEFYPGAYQVDPPDLAGRDVIFVDFSYKRPVMEKILEQAASVIVLDHHQSAVIDLDGLSFTDSLFDMARSGAMLAWNFYFPGEEPPEFIKYVQDRDLWQWKLENSKEVSAGMFTYPYEFSSLDWFAEPEALSYLKRDGATVYRKQMKDIEELIASNKRSMVIGGYTVPVANIPYLMASEACNIMAKDVEFAACYSDTAEGRVFSLRSAETGIDVSEVAKKYGGGGHFHASGFKVPIGWEGDSADT